MKPIKSGTLTYQECARCRKLMLEVHDHELCRACERLGALERVVEAAPEAVLMLSDWARGHAEFTTDDAFRVCRQLRDALDALAPSEPPEAPEG